MKEKQLQHFKQILLKKKQVEEQLLEQDHHLEKTELGSYDTTHPGDYATDLIIQTTEMAIDEFREDEIEKIEAALAAIELGTYGKCMECGQSIPIERLEIVPTALVCVEHAEQ